MDMAVEKKNEEVIDLLSSDIAPQPTQPKKQVARGIKETIFC